MTVEKSRKSHDHGNILREPLISTEGREEDMEAKLNEKHRTIAADAAAIRTIYGHILHASSNQQGSINSIEDAIFKTANSAGHATEELRKFSDTATKRNRRYMFYTAIIFSILTIWFLVLLMVKWSTK